MPIRSALYVDGFNLYHALDALGKAHLKWLDLRKLGQRILIDRREEELVLVRYFTALKKSSPEKIQRHTEYISALQYEQVSVIKGHFTSKKTECRSCSHAWLADTEKETDVNLALNIVVDAFKDLYDVAYIVTADSDQGATFRTMKQLFPSKRLVTVAPLGMAHSKSILSYSNMKIGLNEAIITQCLLPSERFRTADGQARLLYRRPRAYDPPQG